MNRPKVLVVDDDAFSRTVVSKKLKAHADVLEAEHDVGLAVREQPVGVEEFRAWAAAAHSMSEAAARQPANDLDIENLSITGVRR